MSLRSSVAIAIVSGVLHLVVGIVLMTIGFGVVVYQIGQEPHNNTLIYTFLIVGVFGALILPTILPTVKQIVVLVFPNGIPWPGGRRAGDPPAAQR